MRVAVETARQGRPNDLALRALRALGERDRGERVLDPRSLDFALDVLEALVGRSEGGAAAEWDPDRLLDADQRLRGEVRRAEDALRGLDPEEYAEAHFLATRMLERIPDADPDTVAAAWHMMREEAILTVARRRALRNGKGTKR